MEKKIALQIIHKNGTVERITLESGVDANGIFKWFDNEKISDKSKLNTWNGENIVSSIVKGSIVSIRRVEE